jgi:three-Cys-motif partner protein
MARYWGFWTRGKLELLRNYLDAFTTASKSQSEIIYLDVFGGQPENRERLTEDVLDGSARIALATSNSPFSRLRFFELEPYAGRLEAKLRPPNPGREVKVVAGECNQTIHAALAELRPWNWAPTFAFVDPNGPDMAWSTLEALSRFKKVGSTKAEICLLLAAGMFIRNLRTSGQVRDEDARKLTLMYGTDQWRVIYKARVRGELSPADAREEYVNLMRWRLETAGPASSPEPPGGGSGPARCSKLRRRHDDSSAATRDALRGLTPPVSGMGWGVGSRGLPRRGH